MLVSESFFVQNWSIIRVYPDESIICPHVYNDYLCVQLYVKDQTKKQLQAEMSQTRDKQDRQGHGSLQNTQRTSHITLGTYDKSNIQSNNNGWGQDLFGT